MNREGSPPLGSRPFAVLEEALVPLGLLLRGGCALIPEDGLGDGTLLLVGSVGSAFWAVASPQFAAVDHPMDAWTRQRLDPVAAAVGAEVLYPFDGPPFYPFQRWLGRACGLSASPTGVLIDPVYGLWHAVRAALILRTPWDGPVRAPVGDLCASCREKPCLTACPAGAIQPTGPQPDRCLSELTGQDRATCRVQGCAARLACPVGQAFRYPPDQQAFHQRAFLRLVTGPTAEEDPC